MTANHAAPARLVQFLSWDQGDVALLKIDKTGLSSILLSPGDDIQVGDELLSVGYSASDSLDGEALALIRELTVGSRRQHPAQRSGAGSKQAMRAGLLSFQS